MSLDYDILKCRRCGVNFKSTEQDPGDCNICPSCRVYRKRCEEEAHKTLIRRLRGKTLDCSYCNERGSIGGITCPRCGGRGKIPMTVKPGEYVERDLPSDFG